MSQDVGGRLDVRRWATQMATHGLIFVNLDKYYVRLGPWKRQERPEIIKKEEEKSEFLKTLLMLM